jgi:SAM-dependent methyltransferase
MPDMKNEERFSNRAELYLKYRPTYPDSLLQLLEKEAGFSQGTRIADIGSGTGFSSELLLKHGCKVFGVEPNDAMRQIAEQYLQHYSEFVSQKGTASNTHLPDQSVDGILCAQSFHWFHDSATLQEFQRIARPGAKLAIIWYDRDEAHPFQQAYQELIDRFAIDYQLISHKQISDEEINAFFGHSGYQKFIVPHEQRLDLDGLIGRTLSCSYMPNEHAMNYVEMLEAVRSLFSRFEEDGILIFAYVLRIYIGLV